jgi:hypothetical protein
MNKNMKLLAAAGATSVFALAVGARHIEIERQVEGNPSFAEIGCVGFDPVTWQPSEKNEACDDNQGWISVLSVSGKSFDISHGFNRETLKAQANNALAVTYTDTLLNATLDKLPEFAQSLKIPTELYIIPEEILLGNN